ncbi:MULTISPECIES: fimbria/pilus chaperone family protein [Providencia]|uniref:fimbria/pilus chaperone family protein n=1 Tax=Providencia TaxID=586 RepID=UPI001CFEACDC|nr:MULTISPECIES: fimbria/pilus chaperone family protein [Providencia]EIU7559081.1 fimbria/pilus periplasmic chaperone [Providencia rettgeri]EJD6584818.1 fimbria/pilus periplasmic chaperone [Providencia rettgeri]ELL9156081.1 fimbria/pilus periplasmic chaperone [Providencia rettgeri]ELR5152595.1 fimbria/pilus periplasmic chaperone [Providencia rettgeri]MCB4843019.1 fimbria/pilus periplasmic chaperone [Providencia rettgeri]
MKKMFMNSIISGLLLISGFAHANFQLETMTVILDAAESRKVFNVKNTSKEPILLSTKVTDLEGGEALSKDVMVSPPIVRIEPEQSQQINFVLKNGVNISHEALLKVSFQGVGATKVNSAKMPIRQDVAMLIQPANMAVSQTPWDAIDVSQQGDQLVLKNTGKQVVRLAPNFTALPGNESYSVGQFYLRPDESKSITVKGKLSEIKLTPLSRYGFKMSNEATLKVNLYR